LVAVWAVVDAWAAQCAPAPAPGPAPSPVPVPGRAGGEPASGGFDGETCVASDASLLDVAFFGARLRRRWSACGAAGLPVEDSDVEPVASPPPAFTSSTLLVEPAIRDVISRVNILAMRQALLHLIQKFAYLGGWIAVGLGRCGCRLQKILDSCF
jgi:hypothetical protein